MAVLLSLRATPRGVLASGSFCCAVTWLKSLFACVAASSATVDIHISSGAALVQLNSDLSVPNHSGHHVTVCPLLVANQGRRRCHTNLCAIMNL